MFTIAYRNVFRQKRRSLITSLAMFGGFLLASVSLGFISGTFGDMVEQFTRNNLGHIQIHSKGYFEKPTLYNTIDNYEILAEKVLTHNGVESWAPRIYSGGLVSVGNNTAGASIFGIHPVHETRTLNFESQVEAGEMLSDTPSKSVLIGKGLAKLLEASVGDSLVIVSQAADGSIANDIYRITGITSSGNEVADRSTVYLDIRDAQELFVLENRAHELVFVVDNTDKVAKYTR
ncbi:MAG: ABC transporter permease, partial [bacterium]